MTLAAGATVKRRCLVRHRWTVWEKVRVVTSPFAGFDVQERRCKDCGKYQQSSIGA